MIKRTIDILLSLLLLLVFSPLLIVSVIVLGVGSGGIVTSANVIGRSGKPFSRYQFDLGPSHNGEEGKFAVLLKKLSLYRLPVLLNVLAGDMSLVGPSAMEVNESDEMPGYVERNIRPGVTGLYELRSAANIAHESRAEADREYMDSQSLKGDMGILLRSLIMLFLGKKSDEREAPSHITLLDISMDNLTMGEAIDWIIFRAGVDKPAQLAFVNPDCMNISSVNPDYKSLLQRIDRVFADGIGIHVACRMLDVSMADNVNGTDLFPFLCERAEKEQVPLYFLGGKPGITDAMVDVLEKRYPELRVAGHRHGYFSEDEEEDVIKSIRDSGARILLVAFGAPRQEMWINEHLGELGVGVAMGVGGLFDFVSGRMKRAPRWMREIGMEWVYRLLQEPGRMWRRYIIGNPLFLWRVRQWKRNRERK